MQSVATSDAALDIHRRINQTSRPYPRHSSVPDRFEYWAERRPESPAAVQGDRVVTYRQLDRRANGVAADLIEDGSGPGERIGVCVSRSPEMLIALVGALKAGAAYVPLDSGWPDERLRAAVADAGCRRLLSDRPAELAQRLAGTGCEVMRIDERTLVERDAVPRSRVSAEGIACVNFTSGSVGRPKGVLIRHRGINKLTHNTNFGRLDETSRVLQVTPFTFDIATWEIWGALLNGGVSVLCPPESVRLSSLHRVIRDGCVSIFLLATALFNTVIDEDPSALDGVATITSGGEASSVRHMQKAFRRYGPNRVINLYGPTEITCTATYFPVDDLPTPDESQPIGRPIQNTRVYLLDDDAGTLCEPGRTGEICLAGDSVAAGYLNLPELTAERFIDRSIGGVRERLYRTGDWGRLLPGGDITFDGRRDDQVKVNSYRIELGEITHHLNNHPKVKQSCVAATEAVDGKTLVGFVVPAEPGLAAGELREYLAGKLPRYMVPSRIHLCDVFPLTPNGKIDRQALLTLRDTAPTTTGAHTS